MLILNNKIFETNNISMFFIKHEAQDFLDIFLRNKDLYSFTPADFIVLLETHLLMKGYSNKKIKKFLSIINKNTQNYVADFIKSQKQILDEEIEHKKEIKELVKKDKELEKLENEDEEKD